MNSPTEITPHSEGNTAVQATEVAVVACPGCGTDVLKTGFIVATVSYQAYAFSAGKVVKSYKQKSRVETARCGLCPADLHVSVNVLTGSNAA
jgi:hypothetical protein